MGMKSRDIAGLGKHRITTQTAKRCRDRHLANIDKYTRHECYPLIDRALCLPFLLFESHVLSQQFLYIVTLADNRKRFYLWKRLTHSQVTYRLLCFVWLSVTTVCRDCWFLCRTMEMIHITAWLLSYVFNLKKIMTQDNKILYFYFEVI